jgi:hypothetical protein
MRLGLMLAVAGVVILTSGESGAFRASTERMSAGNAACDAYVDLGNTADEDFHNLVPQGWDGSQGPPNNPHVSPSGDWTKRYQKIGQANSVDLCPTTGADSYFLLAEVEDGQCKDDFEIWVGPCGESQEQVYAYQARPNQPSTVGRHVAKVKANLVQACTTVRFQNKGDACGAAAVYNVSIQTERPSTIVVVRDEWEPESHQCPTPETCNPDRPELAIARVDEFENADGLVLANDFSGEYHRADATPLAPGILATTVAVRPNDAGKITFRVAMRAGSLPSCTLIKVNANGVKLYECSAHSITITVSANTNADAQAKGGGGAQYRAAYMRYSPYSGNDSGCPVAGASTGSDSALQGRCMFGSAGLVITPAKVLREECQGTEDYCALQATERQETLAAAANEFKVPKLVLHGLLKSEDSAQFKEDPDGTYRTFITFDGGIGHSQVTQHAIGELLTKETVLQKLAKYCPAVPSKSYELLSCVAKSPEANIYAGAGYLAEVKWSSAECQIPEIPETDQTKVIANWKQPVYRYKGLYASVDDVKKVFCYPELPFSQQQQWNQPLYVQDYADPDVVAGSGTCTLEQVFRSGCGGQQFTVGLHQGEQQDVNVTILADQTEADFYTQGYASAISTNLMAPDGTVIDPESADPDVYHASGLTYELYRISSPQAGQWTVRLFGTELPPEGEDITVWVASSRGPDADGDGFYDAVEDYLGTDPLDACPDVTGTPGLCPGPSCDGDDAWPFDNNIDTWSNVLDVLQYKGHLQICVPDPNYVERLDINADECVNVLDVLLYKEHLQVQCANP